MQYKKATHVLPKKLLEEVQEYVDGTYLYIPRVTEKKKQWGAATATRVELKRRNESIYRGYLAGTGTKELADRYYLSPKSVQRIIRQEKQKKSKE